MKINSYLLLLFIVLTACSKRNLTYFSNLPENSVYTETISNVIEPQIQPDDLLSITVSTLNPESNLLFNSGVLTTIGSNNNSGTVSKLNDGYLVDKNGAVNFPILGKVVLAGLTMEEATEKMTDRLQSEVKNPIVNIRLLNFRITVIGEVSRPSTFTVPTQKISIIEALGLAGDLTVYGRRENVLLIREKEGVRSTLRLDLNNKDVLSSPYFYLQQNDIVYVEPVKAKAEQTNLTRTYVSFTLSVMSVITVILFRFL
ncbi:polysaccharide biosynthesis/export family protein [Catalinimonas niigatensis]|uniref:polysaccharide biosynthesis/export family protein n=1 Tax=Catalinimonas niigatensis TaxID=1397264 RepID=UPI0026654BCD|nr:polysaccharide biosynthesis/export family protein [Catalinimonas niigatensis]WPP52911.1 polysaccharide biosynthesis/export family protein [Catalinimonas niigatensis]